MRVFGVATCACSVCSHPHGLDAHVRVLGVTTCACSECLDLRDHKHVLGVLMCSQARARCAYMCVLSVTTCARACVRVLGMRGGTHVRSRWRHVLCVLTEACLACQVHVLAHLPCVATCAYWM